MSMEADLYSYLSTHADAAALRTLVNSKIFWGTIPQNESMPYIRVNTVTTEPGKTLGGDDGQTTSTLQFSIFDQQHPVCVSIREALRSLLHDNKRFTEGTTVFHHILMGEYFEDWVDEPDYGYMHMPVDFQFYHSTT